MRLLNFVMCRSIVSTARNWEVLAFPSFRVVHFGVFFSIFVHLRLLLTNDTRNHLWILNQKHVNYSMLAKLNLTVKDACFCFMEPKSICFIIWYVFAIRLITFLSFFRQSENVSISNLMTTISVLSFTFFLSFPREFTVYLDLSIAFVQPMNQLKCIISTFFDSIFSTAQFFI